MNIIKLLIYVETVLRLVRINFVISDVQTLSSPEF
jgi:hypothetical protein